MATRIHIRRIASNRISSRISTDSAQNPMTKKRTTRAEPIPTKRGSIPSMILQGPPPLNPVGDCPKSSNTRLTWLFPVSYTHLLNSFLFDMFQPFCHLSHDIQKECLIKELHSFCPILFLLYRLIIFAVA